MRVPQPLLVILVVDGNVRDVFARSVEDLDAVVQDLPLDVDWVAGRRDGGDLKNVVRMSAISKEESGVTRRGLRRDGERSVVRIERHGERIAVAARVLEELVLRNGTIRRTRDAIVGVRTKTVDTRGYQYYTK
jgi:hypothetical protein